MTAVDAPQATRVQKPGPTAVGIGASAGGLAALKELFAHVPSDSGLAFVVVVHLSPEHESHLAELLQPHVKMPVQQVTETTPLEPNRVYVIPPGRNLSTIDTHLRLSDLEERRRERAPIDHFFRTLAETHNGHAIAVVLTGTGSDGALGIKDIKEGGGLTIVQDPNDAEYDGMPLSAIATGLVDFVLRLAEIPAAVLGFARTEPRVLVPEDDRDVTDEARHLLQKVFAQLRVRTGRDFSRYKRSTILRRISRRMQLQGCEELQDYEDLLRSRPEETRLLADDLLITVTNFFRDAEVFEKLAKDVVPRLFSGKGAGDDLRVWSVGCATGEEAYSLAMLLLEEAARRDASPRLQIFASDLHEHSLGRAREGFYAGDIEADVTPERLRRFFVSESGGYRVRKELRETVVFAPHNLLVDPPFSRLDLIACRNVLIYLQREIQQDVVELFHYALRQEGFLLLGTSETVDGSDLFRVEDKKTRLYRKRNVPMPEPRVPVFPLTRSGPQHEAQSGGPSAEMAYGTVHQRMVEQLAPPSLLLSAEDKIVHLSERAGRYLVHPGGEITMSIFKLVREELRTELRATLHEARHRQAPTRTKPLLVQFNGEVRPVVLQVRPALDRRQEGFALVIFDELEHAPADTGAAEGASATGRQERSAGREHEMRTELDLTRQRLRAIIEEHETSQEEMKAANEELQSTNEELRSTMEELETSKEELQSMNEELQTVNQENRHKVEELGLLSADLQNLLIATDIATLFLDRELRILRFTPRVGELFNVRMTDRGRPLSDLTHNLGSVDLGRDAASVLARLVPIEREIVDHSGNWYLTRLLPYRSMDDRIEGVVVTFVEITEHRRAAEELRNADRRKEEFLALLAHELRNPLAALRNGLMLIERSPRDAEVVDRVLEMMERQMRVLVHLIDDLLDIGRINRGRLALRCDRIDLAPVIRHAVEATLPSGTDREVELALPDEPVWVDGDAVRISQVLGNLLSNAYKFTRPGGRIRVSADRREPHVVIAIEDDGEGIASDRLGGIFHKFPTIPSQQRQAGLGIGLTLVKRLVEMHGGSVMASSAGPGAGSRFEVRLPLAVASPPARGARPELPKPKDVTGLRILVVDDNEDVARSLAMLLEVAGNDVQMAHDGDDALRAAESFRPELVLLDIGLPNADGYEVARRIREQPWGRPMVIFAVSGWGQDDDRQRSVEAGMDRHLVKPVDVAGLGPLLDEVRAARGGAPLPPP